MLRTVHATRYVTPLREGGSLPAIIEADDDGLYVLKFKAAGQGTKALIAELIGGAIGRALGLRVPEIVFVELDAALGRNEPDYEIRELLTKSEGLNLALDYLPGSITFDPKANGNVDRNLASMIVWLDAYLTNVDRTPRNTNMLMWHKNLWLIDHGAALFFHHSGQPYAEKALSPFTQIKDHVLLPAADALDDADQLAKESLSEDFFDAVLREIPDEWLGSPVYPTVDEHRAAYVHYLVTRLGSSSVFLEEARRAHARLV
jgi:hypothetical protein